MREIDQELRQAIMRVLQRLAYYHPALRNPDGCGRPGCWACRDATALVNLLDAEQREYGPPIDVTDPSYIRMEASQP